MVDNLDLTCILANYPGGGASSFHPRMMIKVLVYAYLNNIYTSRKTAKALKENINSFQEKYGKYPKSAIPDAGYGGLENYDFLARYDIDNFVKHNYIHKEQTKKVKTDIAKSNTFITTNIICITSISSCSITP